MLYLNLSEGFNPLKSDPSETINHEIFIFSGGEPHIKIEHNHHKVRKETEAGGWCEVWITQRINSFEDLGVLMVAVDALKNTYPLDNIFLYLPYFPGARQDRRMVFGEPLTAKVYADVINSLGFKAVRILDPHSDVAPALIDNCFPANNHNFVLKCVETLFSGELSDRYDSEKPFFNVVSPDAGSNKKIKDVTKELFSSDYPCNLIKCDKTRDVATGKIKGFEVYADDLGSMPTIIIDDICDGGGTFLGLAEELINKNCGKLYLIVTHGIFSKGFTFLEKYFDGVFTTDSFYKGPNKHHRSRSGGESDKVLTVIKLEDL